MAYTNIDDPSAFFQTLLWTGNSSDGRALTNDGNSDLKPDLVWLKNRNAGYNHFLQDSSRGNTKVLNSDSNTAESTYTNMVESFDTNGFTVGFDGGQVPNFNGNTFVGWQWKANGGTTSTNNDGNHTSVVQANQDAGFSIITYTGTGNTSTTIGHGLGTTPDLIIFKRREAGTNNWDVQIKGTSRTTLNVDGTEATNVLCTFTSTTTNLGSTATAEKNAANATYVAYAFASKQGYSKIGRYVGNGNTNGTFVYTGFKPAWVLIKGNSNYKYWYILDNKVGGQNVINTGISPSNTFAEATSSVLNIDFLSNGFKLRNGDTTINENGTNTLYMAFAENPFVTSTGIPTTAR